MDLSDLINSILYFLSRWVGTTVPRVAAAFFGLVSIFLAIAALWDRRIKPLAGAAGLFIGLILVIAALDPEIVHILAQTSYFTRIRVLMIALSFVVIIITIEAIRRSHLQERYAILWIATSLIILVTAFFPKILDFIIILLGTDYVTSVVGIIFTFLLLIAFHFSISLSTFRKNQARIAQRYALLEERIDHLARKLSAGEIIDEQTDHLTKPVETNIVVPAIDEAIAPERRAVRGSQIAIPIIIIGMLLIVFTIGILTPQPMVGDEVTHFYMLSRQAQYLSKPNFYADIPTGWGEIEQRRYPHTFLWHYIGAVFYRATGNNFHVVQLYQALFWAQLLLFAYLLAKSRNGIENRSALLYIILIASLPVAIIFSVTFYQDVPMTAQVLASFYFLRRRRWLVGTLFLCLGIGFKITALLFLPAYLILMIIWEVKGRGWLQGMINTALAVLILFFFTLTMGQIIKTHAQSEFYPEIKARQLLSKFIDPKIQETMVHQPQAKEKETGPATVNIKDPKPVTPYEVEIIANHPGDLRIFENYVVYGGVILWIIILTGCISLIFNKAGISCNLIGNGSPVWLLVVGLSYTLFAAFFLKTAPDARFFLPGVPFFILPFVEKTVRLPKPKVIIAVLSALAVLQAGYVLAKTYKIRHVSSDTWSAIGYLKQNEPSPRTVFMYPEGNYRLFPVPHEWYLNYKLREFWFADNDKRIQMLNHFGIGAIVIKKHLIAEVDLEIINLGVYPVFFVRDLRGDSRFEKVFENDGVIIFKVPPLFEKEKLKIGVSN